MFWQKRHFSNTSRLHGEKSWGTKVGRPEETREEMSGGATEPRSCKHLRLVKRNQTPPTCLGLFPHFFHGGRKLGWESEIRKGGVEVSSASPRNFTDLLLPLLFIITELVAIVGSCILVPQATIPPILHPIHYMCVPLSPGPSTMFLLAGTDNRNQRLRVTACEVAHHHFHPLSATFTMAAEWQNPPDADVILRASGGREFHAHRLILSLASPVFRDMFSIPQPSDGSSQIPIIDVGDPPEALEVFLQVIYPFRNPPIEDVEAMASLLRLADKYDAKVALDAYKDYLPSMCIDPPPIHMYAVMCAFGREKEARAAARRVSFASLAHLNSCPLLRLMTVEHYQRLIKFMIARDQKMRAIVSSHQSKIALDFKYGCNDYAHILYASNITGPIQAAFEADPCIRVVEALGLVPSAARASTLCRDVDCRYDTSKLQVYAESLLEELAEMAGSFPWVD